MLPHPPGCLGGAQAPHPDHETRGSLCPLLHLLEAGEIRHETYSVAIPPDAKGKVTLDAKLNYLAYPSSFTGRLGLRKPERVEVTSTRAEISVH